MCWEPLFELMGIHEGLVGPDRYAQHRATLALANNGSLTLFSVLVIKTCQETASPWPP